MYSAGIDIGSVATKGVIYNGEVAESVIIPTGWSPRDASRLALNMVLDKSGVSRDAMKSIIATGYGRVSADFASRAVTEITCHARGAFHLFPDTRTVVDIGGQDSKVIALNEEGGVADFIMNDKCAAGTGRFLQVMAGVLDASLEELGAIAVGADPVQISSMCTVFAESEIIGLLARGVDKGRIAAGIFQAISHRIQGLAGRVPLSEKVTFSGGVALNPEICRAIGAGLGVSLYLPKHPQLVGALGAALLGFEQ